MKLEMKSVRLISSANCSCHIGAREGHDQRAWRVSSRPFLQLGQQESKINFRRNKLVLVGNESDPTCHSKDQTLFGTCSCQILFQIVFITSTFDAPIPAISSPSMATPGNIFRVFLNKYKLHNLIKRKCYILTTTTIKKYANT